MTIRYEDQPSLKLRPAGTVTRGHGKKDRHGDAGTRGHGEKTTLRQLNPTCSKAYSASPPSALFVRWILEIGLLFPYAPLLRITESPHPRVLCSSIPPIRKSRKPAVGPISSAVPRRIRLWFQPKQKPGETGKRREERESTIRLPGPLGLIPLFGLERRIGLDRKNG